MLKKTRCGFSLVVLFGLSMQFGLMDEARAAAPGSLLLNEANTVSGGKYLESGKSDPTLGRLEGNGQNWMNFVVAGNDAGKHTLDLRGWEVDWSYNKDGTSMGSGTMTFSQDPTWAAVPQGTMITVNEYQKAWYLVNTPPAPGNPDGDPYVDPGTGLPGTGMQRDGGINGFGLQTGNAFNPAIDTMRDFSTNTVWNAAAQGGPDWNINVWAGQGLNSATGAAQYFSFSGTVTSSTGVTTNVGRDAAAGLFTANNDNWQFTIKDAQHNVILGPVGEAVSGWGSVNGAGGINSQEVLKLESFASTDNPTAASYQGVNITNYADGSTSSYAAPNQWTTAGAPVTQDLSPLRNWFGNIVTGDANLDGIVDIQDITAAANHWLTNSGWQGGDVNGDGVVDIQDVTAMANHWLQQGGGGGSLGPNVNSVPEPSTGLIATVGILAGTALAFFKRR